MLAIAVAGAACSGPTAAPADPGPATPPPQPPPRTSWTLSHRLLKTPGMPIVGQQIGVYDEGTSVTLGRTAQGAARDCFVTLSVPGSGGPGNMVGEKVPTRVHGRPGFRNGAGAEGDYLMWRLKSGAWVMVSCEALDSSRAIAKIAAAVQVKQSSIAVPFGIRTLPAGYGIASISNTVKPDSATLYVGRPHVDGGQPEPDLEISYEGSDKPLHRPTGRTITIAGRPAMLDETPRNPVVCVLVQQHHVCVSTVSDDTGPYPDRSAELPAIRSIAEGLFYAKDLGNRTTWMAADRVLG